MAIITTNTPVSYLPLYEKIPRKNTIPRAIELVILSLLLALIAYRMVNRKHHGPEWIVAVLCESWFTFSWFLAVSIKWNQVDFITYPDRLLQRYRATELPPVDMFVTTADPVLEPPIITVNTVLSLLAVDYPANKLACYVSDDGCSPLTYYSLVEASKFAKLWVPFCKKYEVQTRAPFRFFASKSSTAKYPSSSEFKQEWQKMKDEYGRLSKKIEYAVQRSLPCELNSDFAVFSNADQRDHPTIVKIVSENKEANADGIPHLVYVSREKRPKHPHHSKAGAMNVLTRVSGVMTNAPFMLNVDCDMYANNPKIFLHGMCVLLGSVGNDTDFAFAQFPQYFYDGIKDDPYGNQFVVFHKIVGHGLAGIQGSFYEGTGCIHRRKVIYGLSPNEKVNPENLNKRDLQSKFGRSSELTKCAAPVISELNVNTKNLGCLASCIESANEVAACVYDYGTSWGKEVGWIYGSQTEDVLTGLTIHKRGWRSAYISPDPAAFLGSAPSGGPATLVQTKRWSTGLLEIFVSTKSPLIATVNGKLWLRQCLAYIWVSSWALRSIPEICYASLPAYCIITNSSFLPRINEPAILIPISLFLFYHLYTLSEYIRSGLSLCAWWNNQKMARINSMTAWLFGLISVILKLLGISQTVFELTQKEQNSGFSDDDVVDANAGKFTFDESPLFIPGTTILLMNLSALVIGILGFQRGKLERYGPGEGEFISSLYVLLCFWVFLRGLFDTGKYGLPSSTIWKSGALALIFVYLCKWVSMDRHLSP